MNINNFCFSLPPYSAQLFIHSFRSEICLPDFGTVVTLREPFGRSGGCVAVSVSAITWMIEGRKIAFAQSPSCRSGKLILTRPHTCCTAYSYVLPFIFSVGICCQDCEAVQTRHVWSFGYMNFKRKVFSCSCFKKRVRHRSKIIKTLR